MQATKRFSVLQIVIITIKFFGCCCATLMNPLTAIIKNDMWQVVTYVNVVTI